MHSFLQIKILFLTISSILLFTVSGHSQNIVQVVGESVNIYSETEPPFTQRIKAQKGDLFELESLSDEWFGIRMFSGKVRYLKMDDAEIEYDFFQKQYDTSKITEVCKEVQMAGRQASEEANSKYPADEIEADKYKNFLIDDMLLTVFREHSIPATHNSIFLDCMNDSLTPFLDY